MANFTEKAIKATFLQLLSQRPVNKITVKDIAAECGINRNSFYYHYSDIPALIEEIFTEEAERLVRLETKSGSLYEYIMYAIDFAIENKTAVYHIYNSANRELFEQYLQRITQKTIVDYLNTNRKTSNIRPDDMDAIVFYYKCLVIGFVIDWLSSGMQYDIREKLRRICDLFDGSMDNAIAICEEEYRKNC